MPRVLISPSARADLEKITDEIAANNGRAVAQRVTLSFERSFKVLADHPRVGRPRPRLGKNLRSWPVSVYLALYRPDVEGVEIVHVLHGKRCITRKVVGS